MHEQAKDILDFIHQAEGLKTLLRHSWLSNDRQESVAEHTWRSALLVIVLSSELGQQVDVGKTLRMILIHDLGEVYAGDHHAFLNTPLTRQEEERAGIKKIVEGLPVKTKDEIIDLWEEFEKAETPEARLAKAVDKIEVLIQHNQAPLYTWSEQELNSDLSISYGNDACLYNPFLCVFKEIITQQTITKLNKDS